MGKLQLLRQLASPAIGARWLCNTFQTGYLARDPRPPVAAAKLTPSWIGFDFFPPSCIMRVRERSPRPAAMTTSITVACVGRKCLYCTNIAHERNEHEINLNVNPNQ